jgi:two-component system chemotaxis sensor kinase CheA
MSADFSPELRAELLDDFYAECDELLTDLRGGLVALEGAARAGGAPDPANLETLFRGVHSLKGISALVGLRVAEELAHAMEDVLRALTKRPRSFPAAIADTLIVAVRRRIFHWHASSGGAKPPAHPFSGTPRNS